MTKAKLVEQPKSKKKLWVGIAVVVCLLAGTAAYARTSKVEYVEKNVINNYVCKVLAADPDEDMFAVQCLTK